MTLDYYMAEGGTALKACQAWDLTTRQRWQERKALVREQGGVGSVCIRGQWGMYFPVPPGPGWRPVAVIGEHRNYLPDPATTEGQDLQARLDALAPPGPAELARLLGLEPGDPHRPVPELRRGLGWVVKVVRQEADSLRPFLPPSVLQLEEAEYFNGRLRAKRRAS